MNHISCYCVENVVGNMIHFFSGFFVGKVKESFSIWIERYIDLK